MALIPRRGVGKWLRCAAGLAVLVAALPAGARAQGAGGSISGTMIDSTGAVLPGVLVTCKNVRTGLTVEASTNQVGIFRCPELPIGQYEVTGALDGFRKIVRSDLSLVTGQALDIKFTMEPGGVETTVEVSGATPLVQTASSTVQTSMTARQVEELPLNGRNPLQLVVLTAGASLTDPGPNVRGQQDNQGLTVNGLRATQNNFRLDGSNYNNRFFGSAPTMPNPDTLEEFTVQSANYSARTAGAGALVELATKSGTNQLRGSAFEFLRDSALNSNDYFGKLAGRPKPPYEQHQFGAALGGPIIQNKTFYFGAYQGTRRRSSPGTSTLRSLTVAERGGNFSNVTTPIIDPTTGQPFPGNIVPTNRLDPLVQQILSDLLPPPNSGLNLVTPTSQDLDDDQVTVRVDHELTSKDRLTARYFYDANRFQRAFNDVPPEFTADNDFRNQSFMVRDNHVFSNNFLLSVSGAYSKFRRVQEPLTPNAKTLQDYGVNAAQSITTNFFPGVRFFAAPLFRLFSGGGLEQTPSTWDFKATAIWSKGRHNLQFGVDTQLDRLYVLDASFTVGTWTFNGSRTGYLPADIVLGLPSLFVQDSGRTIELAESKYHFWVQDDWKVTNTLTLNAGLRWEPWLPPTDSLNNLVGFVEGQRSTMAPDAPLGMVYPGDADIPETLFSKDWGAWAPRIGFAWDVRGTGRTVLRGGYGIFYIDPALTIYTRTVSTQPSVATVNIVNPFSFQDPYRGVAGGNPYPFPRVQPEDFDTFRYVRPVSGGVLDPAAEKGYSQNWNITFEQQILWDVALSLAYVGNRGTDIMGALQLNPAVSGPGATTGNTQARRIYSANGMGAMEIATPYQRSEYNGFQVTATKRASRGLTLLGTYVLGKVEDNNSITIEGDGSWPRSSLDPDIDWGPADFDVRHRVNISFVYDLPRSESFTGITNVLLNDWQVNGIFAARSGLPYTVKSGTDRSLTAINQDNADQVGDPAPPAGSDKTLWFNPAAFTAAAVGTFGNVSRNSFRGPGFATFDFALAKNFRITQRSRLQFRWETFNLFNRANFNNPNSPNNPTVTQLSNFGKLLTAQDPRVMQFGLRFTF